MPKCLEGYKIVKVNDDGGYSSAILCSASDAFMRNATVIYKKGKCTKRNEPNGPLAVFRTYDDVRRFISYGSRYNWVSGFHYMIFRCSYVPTTDIPRLWCIRPDGSYEVRTNLSVPPGTAFADKVILNEAYACFTLETRDMI